MSGDWGNAAVQMGRAFEKDRDWEAAVDFDCVLFRRFIERTGFR